MFQINIKDYILTIKSENNLLFKHSVLEENDSYEIFGVYGSFEFNGCVYLVLVDKATKVGDLKNFPVFEIKNTKTIIFKPADKFDLNEINYIKEIITDLFKLPGMYFSKTDLFIRQSFKNNEDNDKLSHINHPFLFNGYPISHFKKIAENIKNNDLILNCIQGYFGVFENLVLISRRCPQRVGSRYFSRGLNKNGFPSNFVETEQFIMNSNSYIHLRGSIPLIWKHHIGYRYKPSITVINDRFNNDSAKKAHEILVNIYNKPVIYMNLIHKDGYEGELHQKFNQYYGPPLSTVYNYDLKRDHGNIEFPIKFNKTGFNSKTNTQNKIIRTNCIDSLDRTNSMQYFIGKAILEDQLENAKISNKDDYRKGFQNLFYQNGNNLSIQYVGTDAQASYFILNGKRTISGTIYDLYTSFSRYFYNRYKQGKQQNAYEIISGQRTTGDVLKNSRINILTALIVFIPILIGLFLSEKIGLALKIAVVILVLVLMLSFSMDFPLSYK